MEKQPNPNVELLQSTVDEILPGLTLFVRDCDLSPVCAPRYEPGTILMERGFTDASNRVMGMVTTHRIAILSNHMMDFQPYEHDTNWGLFVARNNSHFKVLDVYEYEGKTQILLFHLPDDDRWRLFENTVLSVEEQLITDCRKRFEDKSRKEPVPELATQAWLDRCRDPVGMNDDGILFDLRPLVGSELHPVKGADFRKFYHRIVYLSCRDLIAQIAPTQFKPEDTGVLAYGYISEQVGLCFLPIMLAAAEENTIHLRDFRARPGFRIELSRLESAEYLDASRVDLGDIRFYDLEEPADPEPPTGDMEELRSVRFLDPCRHPLLPDYVSCILKQKDLDEERVWVRLDRVGKKDLSGILATEPKGRFSVRKGGRVSVLAQKMSNGEVVCTARVILPSSPMTHRGRD